jgi:autotransporter-associated beta strand protein
MNHTLSSLLSFPFVRVLGVVRLGLLTCLSLVGFLLVTPHANAQTTDTWTGGGADNLVLNNANWDTGQFPQTGDSLIFAGVIRLTPTLNSALSIASISFASGAGAFVLGGTGTYTISTGAGVTNSSTNTETINNAITLGVAQTWYATSGNLVFGGNVNTNGKQLTINGAKDTSIGTGVVSGTGRLTKTSTGTLTLSGANTYSGGTTLSAGTLNINNAKALGTGTFTINGGTIDNTTAGAITLSNNNLVTFGGNFTFGGTKNLDFGTGAITNAGNRTITLNGTNSTLTFGGTMTNTSNAVQTTTVNGAGNTLSLGGYALSSNGTNRIDVINGTGNVTITGAITNGGSATASGLTYGGSGRLTLTGTNTYKGATTVNAGTLLVNGNNSAATGAVSVNNSGTTLGGTGTIGGAVTVGSGAKLLGGTGSTASGTLTLAGGLTLSSGSIIELALGASGAHSTLTRSGGAWTFATNQAFNFIDLGAQATTYSSIITGLTADPGGEGSWTIMDAGWIGSFAYNGGNIDLTITNAPEPATYLTGVLTLGALLLHQRRRWRCLLRRHVTSHL